MRDEVTIIDNVESPKSASHDLLSASQSSLEFWDNPLDDEDWDDA